MEIKNEVPKWLLIVSAIFAIMEIGVSFMLYFSPEEVVENLDVSANGVDFLTLMWAVRQFALGVIFSYATFKRSVAMLTICYIFLLVMFLGDLTIGILKRDAGLISATIVMCIIAVGLLYKLNKVRN